MDPDFCKGKLVVSRYRFFVLHFGLLLAVLLATLDQALVASALRSIAIEMNNKAGYLPYIGSAYGISMIPSLLLCEKIAPHFGLKWAFLLALLVFEAGSTVCSRASNMESLVVGRAISGFGAGGLILLYMTLTSKIVSVQDEVLLFFKNDSAFEGFAGIMLFISAIASPSLGGFFADFDWRYCFYIEMLLGVIPAVIVYRYLDFSAEKVNTEVDESVSSADENIDYLGVGSLFASITCLIVPLQLYQVSWDWKSAQSICMYTFSLLFFLAFVFIEWRVAKDPVVPRLMFVNSTVPSMMVTSFCIGATFICGLWNVALFFQINFNDNQTIAGAYIIPGFFGLLVGASVAKRMTARFDNYTFAFYVGPIILAGGIWLLAFLDDDSLVVERICYLGVFGFGEGVLHLTRSMALRAASPKKLSFRFVILALACLVFGSAFSITISGTVLKTIFSANVSDSIPIQTAGDALKSKGIHVVAPVDPFRLLKDLAAESGAIGNGSIFKEAVVEMLRCYNNAYRIAFLCLLPYPLIMLCLAPFVKQYPMDD
ncbi:UNVERIFIED_CONTAM: hypothetical protein HDU68_008955 [Siphonaria sp. JEL0065]|nr:hypothetical protein HDU68_008955 [Siphonaria sp. JEL0065]